VLPELEVLVLEEAWRDVQLPSLHGHSVVALADLQNAACSQVRDVEEGLLPEAHRRPLRQPHVRGAHAEPVHAHSEQELERPVVYLALAVSAS
jgi:acyl-coenzyme A thioesterase PaaI-like protein